MEEYRGEFFHLANMLQGQDCDARCAESRDDSKCGLCLHTVHSLVRRKASESCRLEGGPSELRGE